MHAKLNLGTRPLTKVVTAACVGLLLAAAGCKHGQSRVNTNLISLDETQLTAKLSEFQIAPYKESIKCAYFQLPKDEDILLSGYDIDLNANSHHFGVWYTPPESPYLKDIPKNGEVVDCDDAVKGYVAGSEWDKVSINYPKGTAQRIPKGSVLVMEAHWINAGEKPITGGGTFHLRRAKQPDVTTEVGVILDGMLNFKIEPRQKARFTAKCPLEGDVDLIFLSSHMHEQGTEFIMSIVDDKTGEKEKVYENHDYAEPLAIRAYGDDVPGSVKPIHVPKGKSIEWTCTYNNKLDKGFLGGPYGMEGLMCNFVLLYAPYTGASPYCMAEAKTEIL